MSDGRETDERLKSWLNSNQPGRERMCIAILQVTDGYSHVEPRRPEGGPDGARDIQCRRDGRKCFGAVGFKNGANDSDKMIRETIVKFKDDLNGALKADPEIRDFVFLTNIDLTPGQLDELKEHANKLSVEADILHRERLRLALDRAEGYGIRFQYLSLPLSEPEQASFFNRFGKDLQTIIAGKLDAITNRLEELQFVNWAKGTCREIQVVIKLNERYSVESPASEHEPFRFALRLSRVRMYGEGDILLACYSEIHDYNGRADFEVKRFIYCDTDLLPNERRTTKRLDNGGRLLGAPFKDIRIGVAFGSQNGHAGGITLSSLSQYALDFYCDSSWAERVSTVEVWFDDYLVEEFTSRCRRDDKSKIFEWPGEMPFADRPAQFWHGWGFRPDTVCRRRLLSNPFADEI